MRLSECPGYGIAFYADGEIAFLKPHPGPHTTFNCRVTFYPTVTGVWGTILGKGYRNTICRRDDDPIQRFWKLEPAEVEKVEIRIRERLEK